MEARSAIVLPNQRGEISLRGRSTVYASGVSTLKKSTIKWQMTAALLRRERERAKAKEREILMPKIRTKEEDAQHARRRYYYIIMNPSYLRAHRVCIV